MRGPEDVCDLLGFSKFCEIFDEKRLIFSGGWGVSWAKIQNFLGRGIGLGGVGGCFGNGSKS